jgi:hypothetical protein
VGDEYARRTGRQRIDYTREEIAFGVSWAPNDRWRAYVEPAWAYKRIESEKPLRLQVGVEHIGRERLWNGQIPWYAAIDSTFYKQDDVQIRTCAQIGLIFATGRGTDRYRLALELLSGRSALGEFSMHDEGYIGLGWFFDF